MQTSGLPEAAFECVLEHTLRYAERDTFRSLRSTCRSLCKLADVVLGAPWVKYWIDSRQTIIDDITAAQYSNTTNILRTILQHPLAAQQRLRGPDGFRERVVRLLDSVRTTVDKTMVILECSGVQLSRWDVQRQVECHIEFDNPELMMCYAHLCDLSTQRDFMLLHNATKCISALELI